MSNNEHLSLDAVHNYWRDPKEPGNLPEAYITPIERSQYLYELIKKYADVNAKILEPGCNVGRNLNYLLEKGYKNLAGIEISENAVNLLKSTYPELGKNAVIYNAPIENIISDFDTGEFDVVFTMAVFEHIHYESDWIFNEIARISNSYLIIVESENGVSGRHFPRNYKNLFEPMGFTQIEENSFLNRTVRVFKKIK
ncbi:MAG TPA: class I SAM-dependent methyltransferase [Bacillus sp. (in: firmicutes)]|uniref:class I SAM-dependent methyltransferase n=1 Tax=Bacillus litorisediminis TaxID=2922713 RepID=UPI001FAD1B3C|nr:class I SAM-dependent methyltransferase [Bacillus litorisediminis]HWO75352.1 class I SAM-dependent methyltransferase [Bacillus sp. (in: firmicutes)]